MRIFYINFILIYGFYSTAKPTLEFNLQNISINNVNVVRIKPTIDNISVEGADSIFRTDKLNTIFFKSHIQRPKSDFYYSIEEAFKIALNDVSYYILTLSNNLDAYYEKVWLMHFGILRPSYKIRLPALSIVDLEDIYVAADTNEILKKEPSASFLQAPTNVYTYSPPEYPPKSHSLKSVFLKNLNSTEENTLLNGEYLDIKTCCRYFTCPDNAPCTEENKRCALESHPQAQYNHELIELSTGSLGLNAIFQAPEKISIDTIRCTNLGLAKAHKKNKNSSNIGFFPTPIDEPGIPSDMDAFSEVQAYFSISSFFNHIRFLLNNKTWCLRKEAMLCDENGKAIRKYQILVNQLTPKADQELYEQLNLGKGTYQNPIVLTHLERMNNAAFVPALSTLGKTKPRADEILSDLIKPYDHNVFFQGDRDFAYDGDVVFHEFMHAVTASLVQGKLNTLGLDKWGINSEPGSLNEGFSDYFAASFTNDPLLGEYAAIYGESGEIGQRNLDNNSSCPNEIVGEAHNDSLVWSGALWEIRQSIANTFHKNLIIEFDRSILTSLAMASSKEDFLLQSEKLLKNIELNPHLGPKVLALAKKIFEKRGVNNCQRAHRLPKKQLFVPSKNNIGLKNFAPANGPLLIEIPPGTKSFTISWTQFLGTFGPLSGKVADPSSLPEMKPLGVLVSFLEPTEWQYEKTVVKPDFDTNEQKNQASFINNKWTFTKELSLENCLADVAYVSLVGQDFPYVLKDINVEFIKYDHKDNFFCLNPKGCNNSQIPFELIGLLFIYILIKRYKNYLIHKK